MKTFFPILDEQLGDFSPGLYQLTGTTGSGKTIFLKSIAENISRQEKKVLFISDENKLKFSGNVDFLNVKKDHNEINFNGYMDALIGNAEEYDLIIDEILFSRFKKMDLKLFSQNIRILSLTMLEKKCRHFSSRQVPRERANKSIQMKYSLPQPFMYSLNGLFQIENKEGLTIVSPIKNRYGSKDVQKIKLVK